jgi:hypothetical protein
MKKTKQPKRLELQKGEVVAVHRSEIVDDDINPRTITEDNMRRLKESIRKNGLVGHLVYNKATKHIVGGHQRLAALDSIMRTKDYVLDVLRVDMPLKDEIRLNVALNQQDSQGEFDFDMIGSLAKDFDLDLSDDFGFSEDTIDVNFPDFSVNDDTPADEGKATASQEDIAKMKEAKRATRERNKEFRQEYGDFNGDAKGVLTVVFDRESAKRQWFLDRGIDEPPNVIHVNELEKLFVNR